MFFFLKTWFCLLDCIWCWMFVLFNFTQQNTSVQNQNFRIKNRFKHIFFSIHNNNPWLIILIFLLILWLDFIMLMLIFFVRRCHSSTIWICHFFSSTLSVVNNNVCICLYVCLCYWLKKMNGTNIKQRWCCVCVG